MEKYEPSNRVSSEMAPGPDVVGEVVQMDWTPKEETKTVRKLDLYLMPLLLGAYFLLCLDRSNISNALTSTLVKDVGITTDEAALGNSLQQAGIVIFEIPSNIILTRIGPGRWIVCQIFCWGTVATFQSFVNNKAQFYATRFLLGMFEGGFIPGAMYTISMFYTRSETATRYMWFYFANYVASGTNALISAGILQMSGLHGWGGWRWLFMIDGAMTLLFGIVLFALLPVSLTHTSPVHGLFNLFSPKQQTIMQSRLLTDDPENRFNRKRISPKEWAKTFLNGRLWMHLFINLIGIPPAAGIQTFGPTIIKSLGFSTVDANALTSVGYYLSVVLGIFLTLFLRKTKLYGVSLVLPYIWATIFAGILYHFDVQSSASKWTMYAIITLLTGGQLIGQPINNAWCSINARSPQERSIGLAMCVIGANLAGLVGQLLFKSADAPKYIPGFIAVFGIYVAAVVIIVAQIGVYHWSNKRLERKEAGSRVSSGGEEDNVMPTPKFLI